MRQNRTTNCHRANLLIQLQQLIINVSRITSSKDRPLISVSKADGELKFLIASQNAVQRPSLVFRLLPPVAS